MSPSLPKSLVVLCLGFGQIVAFASGFYLLGVLGDPMGRDLGLPSGLVFSALTGALLISGLLGPVTGRWLDRHGGKPVLLASNLAFAAALLLLAAATGPVGVLGGLGLLGVGFSVGLYGTPFKILVSLYGDAARRPITAVALLGGLGSSLGWPATAAMIHAFGWRGACLGWALAHLAICLPLHALVVPRAPPPPAHAPDHAPIAWDRRMIQVAVLFAGAWFVSTCMSAHLPRLLRAVGLGQAQAVAAASLVGLAAVSARFLELTVLRKLNPLATLRVAALLHPVGALAVLVFGAAAGPVLALGQGADNGMLTVANGVLPLFLFGPEHYGRRSALLSTPARFLQAGGPLLYGLALSRSPLTALALSGGVCLVMFAMTFGLKPSADAPG